ncbi:helix-turn-helix domain-containing protein [Amycolatopsis cihanbeyliensis]|uniref:PucR-like helix-turn-helix protein n=1 Tax=Amycolatopsis cihanbeyliensis TaxID=1128664 RepID=A0A542DED6_AMYCI|nr:PucR family transcriptional regulator [Amycolatopsis cihanbeyliensis]TQJ01406.1 PucR-like helix-turn-helix protein [Amycolatopsis cihanbeyliensis]
MQVSGRSLANQPWRDLPVEVATVLRPRLDGIALEMIEVIRQQVRGYRRPLDSAFGRDLVAAVRRALHQFVELIENPDGSQRDNVVFFRGLGRTEFRVGRSMDLLQAAYRVGARVACHRYVEIARAAALPTDTVLSLSEAVLAHINALAEESVRGFADAESQSSGQRSRQRRALAERLLERDPDPAASLEPLAAQAEWALPTSIACLTTRKPSNGDSGVLAELDDSVLVLPRGSELHLLLPDPDANGTLGEVEAALRGRTTVLGPTVPLRKAWLSMNCARLVLRLANRGLADLAGLVPATEHLGNAVLLLANDQISDVLSEHALGSLTALASGKAQRLEETLDALLASWGRSAPEVASTLGIHPQTARNRLRQLDELLGDRLADPTFRFEAEIVLRTRALLRSMQGESPTGAN